MTPALRSHLVLVSLLVLCAGCIVVPVLRDAPHADSRRSKIEKRALESIMVGSTTIEEVLLRFGEPDEHFDAPTVFLYRWLRRKYTFLFVLGPYVAGAGDTVETVEYTLHIAFDENNKVSRHKVSEVILSSQDRKWL